jgi:hypothetical protein
MEMFEEHQPEMSIDIDDPSLPLPPLRRSVTHRTLPKKRAIEDLTVEDIEDDDEIDIPETPDLQSTFGARALGQNKRQFRSVFMTCFGTAHELSTLPQKMREWDKVQCFMLANETATTTGRPHVHILAKFTSRVTGTTLWKSIGMNCDLRPVKHWGKAVNYLKKQDPSPISHNMEAAPKPGKRTDLMLDEIKEAIVNGATPAEIASINLEYALKYPNGLKYLQSIFTPLRDPQVKPEVRCYLGLAGSGKTYNARAEVEHKYFQKSPTTKWWDGYAGDTTVICDEVTAGCAPFHELLTYLDYGSPRIEIKGTMVPLRS